MSTTFKHAVIPMTMHVSYHFDDATGRMEPGCPAVSFTRCDVPDNGLSVCAINLTQDQSALFVLALLREIESAAK